MCEVQSVYIYCISVREREGERDGGVQDCGGMREFGVGVRGQACSVSRWMKN